MPLLFVADQDAHGKVIVVPAGTHVGAIVITRNALTFRGEGVDVSVIKADPALPNSFVITTGSIVGGGLCTSVTIEDLTIDADTLSSIIAVIFNSSYNGALFTVLRRVKIINYHRNTIAIAHGAHLVCEDVQLNGNGVGLDIQSTTTGTRVRRMTIVGGTAGIGTAGAANTVPGIDINGVDITLDYWATVTGEEVEPTGFSGQFVSVVSHDQAQRSLYDVIRVLTPIATFDVGESLPATAWEFDRIEVASGVWAQVEAAEGGTLYVGQWRGANSWGAVAAPSGTATLYRVQLGRLFGYTPTRIELNTTGAELGRWRYVAGSPGVFAVDPATDICTMDGPALSTGTKRPLAHGLVTGDGPIHVLTEVSLPGGLSAVTDYYAVRVDDYSFRLATSTANASAGVYVDITSVGTGEHAFGRVPQLVAGSKVHVFRHAIVNPATQTRDVDVGAVHITAAARDARIRNVTVRGGFSDMITVRGAGAGNVLEDCTVDLGQDMGCTVENTQVTQNVRRCRASRVGQIGFFVTGAPGHLEMCRVDNCGLHDYGDGAYGVGADVEAFGTTVSLLGSGARSGRFVPGSFSEVDRTTYVVVTEDEI